MLVLTRKEDERLLIDGGIEIKILSVHGSRVRLGIEAPRHIGVRRGELELPSDRGEDLACSKSEFLPVSGLLLEA